MTDFNNFWRISAEQLKETLHQQVVLDCRFSLTDPNDGHTRYQHNHITGAHYFDLERDGSGPTNLFQERYYIGGKHPLPDLAKLTDQFAKLGIDGNTPVVVYDQGLPMFAARVWWMLRLLGNDQVKILDGGFDAWRAIDGECSTTLSAPVATNWQSNPRLDWIISREQIIEQTHRLVDARAADRFAGLNETLHPIPGHIDGSCNAPFTEHFSDSMVNQQGPTWPDNAIHQCGSGVTACVNLWVDALRGRKELPLYVGSYSDWCAYLATIR